MANASGLAADNLIPGTFHHDSSGTSYAIDMRKGVPSLTFRSTGVSSRFGADISGSEELQYFLGSGHLGTTYLFTKNHYLFESPIAFYKRLNGYGMKPGLEAAAQMPTLPLNDSCLRCHMSIARRPDPGTENHFSESPFLHTGITCEECHGDTARHVRDGGKNSVLNPASLSPMKRDSVCIACHLEGDTNVERPQKSILNFKPGEDIRDYVTYFTYKGVSGTRRAVSEVEQFSMSRCRIASGPAMSCTTCHEMHAPPTEAARAAYYRNKCLTCHTGELFATKHHSENPDCTSCHMPKMGSENIAHVAWTDHRIRRIPATEAVAAKPVAQAELAPVFGEAGDRDLGLAYYNLVVRGDPTRLAMARTLLMRAKAEDAKDIPVLRALGVLSEMTGADAQAEELYRAILLEDPSNLTAKTNLGTLLAKRGRISDAIDLWGPSFERNEDLATLGRNLAVAECMSGEREQAEQILNRALLYSPDLPSLRGVLVEIEGGQRKCAPSGVPVGQTK